MSSKTARASAVKEVGTKKVIPDADYIKNLRYDVSNGIHATQEGAKALLRSYDAQAAEIDTLISKLEGAEAALRDKVLENETQHNELLAAKKVILELEAEFSAVRDTLSRVNFPDTTGK